MTGQALNLKGVNLYLIGMMGAGKTTVGRLLAQHLNYYFFDTDTVIEQFTGQSVNEIFAATGEPEFRCLESQVLSELSAYKNLAIATGGGIVLNRLNWSYLHHGLVIWVDVPVEQLHARLKSDVSRPLLPQQNQLTRLQELLEQRRSLYAQADVQVTVAVDETAQQVAARILQAIPQVLRPEALAPQNGISS